MDAEGQQSATVRVTEGQSERRLRRHFLPAVTSVPGVDYVYVFRAAGTLRVRVLVADFWGPERLGVYDAIEDFADRFDEPTVDFAVLPTGAEPVPPEERDGVAIWYSRRSR